MAQFKFRHGVMGSGKSQDLLRIWRQYTKGELLCPSVLVLTPKKDDRYGSGKVTARDGQQIPAQVISDETPVQYYLDSMHSDIECVLVDEVQFLKPTDIYKLKEFVLMHDIPVIAFGLLKDFQNNLFEASETCLVISEDVQEIETQCGQHKCREKAIMNLRIDSEGNPIRSGDQIKVGGDDHYVSVCHKHWLDPKSL